MNINGYIQNEKNNTRLTGVTVSWIFGNEFPITEIRLVLFGCITTVLVFEIAPTPIVSVVRTSPRLHPDVVDGGIPSRGFLVSGDDRNLEEMERNYDIVTYTI